MSRAYHDPVQRGLTADDYLRLPDDGQRYELIDGELYLMPSPTRTHQELVARLLVLIKTHLNDHGGGQVYVAPFDVILSDDDVVQPDLVVVADDRAHVLTEANVRGAPTLCIEVLSDPRRDRIRKRDLYARVNVREYWIIDPDSYRIEVYRPGDGEYSKPILVERGETLTTPHLPGLTIDVSAVFRDL